ncbi:MAG: UDP-N-acetylmuramoyl-tripeptide--D-alanyl-D-alanine ligase [Marinobacter sp.]|uniref:UDP-N-acetylmuramoyl-tripeptide--D-alanyl-D- alanine ligase n=1 Tax=Marinobacter sp. TaxID=50741 RepID=UPI00299EE15D|nr:UDP-N-acetylmuramoyl-tripeptide--D-alanyl-D-alanine ligase [Marinobacter sp.]MDX1635006.1 UDP-N-acetylmuramoyl-tripeptide--D-alanyl-D-alanine ligase [Marinobacter sp.]
MIRAFSLSETARRLGATPTGADGTFSSVSTDTRSLQPGDLFVALRGENFDGHRFLADAAAGGAVAAVVERANSDIDLPQLVVADTTRALADIALANRLESRARVVAVTGSSGKTTVKEMLSAMLAVQGSTLATQGNLNNHIGAPLTLFRLAPEHEYAVIELGASAVGEIAHTVAMTRPEVSIITNAGEAHLEGFGSYQNIVIGKGEIIDGVSARGTVVLNADDPACETWRGRAGQRQVMTVSRRTGVDADYRIEHHSVDAQGQHFGVAGLAGWQAEVTLPLPGEHNLTNALLAIAAVRAFGLPDDAIRRGLASLKPVKGRLQPITLAEGIDLIDDSYNANPTSMKAALSVLAQRPGRRIAVLGTMAELGPDSVRMHEEVGAWAHNLGIERCLVVGPGTDGYRKGFGHNTEVCVSHSEAVDQLINQLEAPVTVLVKGSRSSAMDRVVEGIKERMKR